MKKYIQYVIAISLLMGSVNKINAQYQNTTIHTPANTSVTALKFVGTDYTSSQKNDAKDYWLIVYNNRITYQGEATRKYNCHAYAWHVSEGGSQVWINTPEQKKYWNDCSYIEVSNPAEATKVSFGGPCYYWDANQGGYVDGCVHSAITTSTADYFISKWGASPLFRHHKNDCPYSIEDLHYYAKPTLTGPTFLTASTTYSIANLPAGASVTWSLSNSQFRMTSANNGTTAVWPLTYNATAVLSAQIGIPGATVTVEKEITSPPLSISGPATLCSEGTYSVNSYLPGTAIEWAQFPWGSFGLLSGQGTSSARFKKLLNGKAKIKATATVNGNTASASKEIAAGTPSRPHVMDIAGHLNTFNSATYTLYYGSTTTSQHVFFINPPESVAVSDWVVEKQHNPSHFQLFDNGTSVIVNPLCLGGGSFTVKGENACGTGTAMTVYLDIKAPSGTGPIDKPQLPLHTGPLSITVSPNPSEDGVITVSVFEEVENTVGESPVPFAGKQSYTLQLWHEVSGLVKTIESDRLSEQIPLYGLPSGIYSVQLRINGQLKATSKLRIR